MSGPRTVKITPERLDAAFAKLDAMDHPPPIDDRPRPDLDEASREPTAFEIELFRLQVELEKANLAVLDAQDGVKSAKEDLKDRRADARSAEAAIGELIRAERSHRQSVFPFLAERWLGPQSRKGPQS